MDEYDKIAIGGIVFIAILGFIFNACIIAGLLGMSNDLATQVRECKGYYVSTDNN